MFFRTRDISYWKRFSQKDGHCIHRGKLQRKLHIEEIVAGTRKPGQIHCALTAEYFMEQVVQLLESELFRMIPNWTFAGATQQS